MTTTLTPAAASRIINAAADAFGVRPRDILSKQRSRSITQARRIAAYLFRRDGLSYCEIGRELGHADHTSAVAAVHKTYKIIAEATNTAFLDKLLLAERALQVKQIRYRIDVAKALGPTVDAEGLRVAG